MKKDAKIFVAGGRGLVGSALLRQLSKQGYSNLLAPTSKELNLLDQNATAEFFAKEKPDYVFMAAAKVGGIHANNTYRADFIQQNLIITTNVVGAAAESGVKGLLFYGSSCIYPKLAEQPIKEASLLTGPLEPTNRPYALAKIAGIELCDSYRRQYDKDFRSIMPCNVYGIGDNFDLENSHVLPGMIHKFHLAKNDNNREVELWGSGKPRREFIYAEDLADAAIYIMNIPKEEYFAKVQHPLVNVGCGEDISIKELAETIQQVVGHQGEIKWDSSMPDGTMRKMVDVSILRELGWKHKTGLKQGIQETYAWFQQNQDNLRT